MYVQSTRKDSILMQQMNMDSQTGILVNGQPYKKSQHIPAQEVGSDETLNAGLGKEQEELCGAAPTFENHNLKNTDLTMMFRMSDFGGDSDKKIYQDIKTEESENSDAIFSVQNEGEVILKMGVLKADDFLTVYDDEDSEDEEESTYTCCRWYNRFHTKVKKWVNKYSKRINVVFKFITFIFYLMYFGYAMYWRFGDEGSMRLLVCTVLGILIICHKIIQKKGCACCILPVLHNREKKACYTRWFLYVAMITFAVVYIVIEVGMKQPQNLVSLAGMVVLVLACTLSSRRIAAIDWHCIFWAISSQFLLAIVLLRTTWGILVITWMADRVTSFMEHGYKASEFVFGKTYKDHGIVLQSMPLLFFIGAFTAILYHFGAMQYMIKAIGRALSLTLCTTPPESISVAANMFLGSSQSALIVKPYLPYMSKSELFSLMVGGFASLSGSVFGIFIGFGAPAEHLLAACIMSAPASFAISKLLVPESKLNKKNKHKYSDTIHLEKYKNVIDATGRGALDAVTVFSSVIVNLYVFYAVLQFINTTLIWFGDRVGVEGLTFQFMVSYLFLPLPLLMGVDIGDCRAIGKLIGYKLVGTNGLAYIMLGKLRDNRELFIQYRSTLATNATWNYNGDDIFLTQWNRTLTDGIISERSTVIATYAMCGFSNFASMGIMMGSLMALVPKRQGVVVNLILKAMIAGNIACYLTACIAGLFHCT
ncbi:sodium/nucleoside cotransporter 2 [Patella vulgata]|uniref:sodium/nucleoside cotransporter 2 n=1 Tax=Patella vulgata TaxID=6465 RepID=UPI00217FD148|nr:sodium/nucleoside cotransporter 2 [Patella vulgata]